MENIDEMFLAGLPVKEIMRKYEVDLVDLMTFLPLPVEEFSKTDIQIHYLGYYLKWIPQEAYYYSVENTNFQARPCPPRIRDPVHAVKSPGLNHRSLQRLPRKKSAFYLIFAKLARAVVPADILVDLRGKV